MAGLGLYQLYIMWTAFIHLQILMSYTCGSVKQVLSVSWIGLILGYVVRRLVIIIIIIIIIIIRRLIPALLSCKCCETRPWRNGFTMVRLSIDARTRIITLYSKAFLVLEIRKRLQEENICISCQSIQNLIAKFWYDQAIGDLPRRRLQCKIIAPMRSLIKETIRSNYVGVAEKIYM